MSNCPPIYNSNGLPILSSSQNSCCPETNTLLTEIRDNLVAGSSNSNTPTFTSTTMQVLNSKGKPVSPDKKVTVVQSINTTTGVPTVSYYEWGTTTPFVLSPTQRLGALLDSDAVAESKEMCDNGTTFLRWFVIENGEPTGTTFDTSINGASYTASGSETIGACLLPSTLNQSVHYTAPQPFCYNNGGALSTWYHRENIVIDNNTGFVVSLNFEYSSDNQNWSTVPPIGTFTAGVCPLPTIVKKNTHSISEEGCANGTPYTRITTNTYNEDTGLLVTQFIIYRDSNGFNSTTMPSGFTLGACPIIPASPVNSFGSGSKVIAGATRASTPNFAGCVDTWISSSFNSNLTSITVTAMSVTDGAEGITPNRVEVLTSDGNLFTMFNGQTSSWSVLSDTASVFGNFTVTCFGNAYANIIYTYK
jgi:hypothetical protein